MNSKLRIRAQKGGYCPKCYAITEEVFAAAVEQRKKERRELVAKTVEDELDDLDLDDLDEVEDEDVEEDEEVEVEEDDDDEDPDEAPKAKRGRKKKSSTKKAAAKPKRSGIGTKELADAAGVESRQLRGYLRSGGYQPRDEREGRYTWPSLKDPEAREIIKNIKAGAVERMNKAKLAELKESKGSKKKATAKKTTKKKTTTRKRKRSSEE